MSEQQKYPLAWPMGQPRTTSRKDAQFNVKKPLPPASNGFVGYAGRSLTIAEAMKRLRIEIDRLRINFDDDCIVSSNLKLNMSGLPRGDQGEPSDPGVAVYWMTRKGERRVMAIDIYNRVADNIAAVARTLEYMRGIERHGGSAVQERAFTGFTALPPPASCWSVLAMDPPKKHEGRDDLLARIRAAHRAGYIVLPRDTNGDVVGAAALNAARDEAFEIAGGRGR
jgi:hypothetical protein